MPAKSIPKGTDPRYKIISVMHEAGKLTFMEIFTYVPRTVVARDMNIKVDVFNKLLAQPDLFSLERIDELAGLVDIELEELMDLWLKYYFEVKAARLV